MKVVTWGRAKTSLGNKGGKFSDLKDDIRPHAAKDR
jgi:hypothetical protein